MLQVSQVFKNNLYKQRFHFKLLSTTKVENLWRKQFSQWGNCFFNSIYQDEIIIKYLNGFLYMSCIHMHYHTIQTLKLYNKILLVKNIFVCFKISLMKNYR